MGQAFLASSLIGLREALEAGLVVSILVASLVTSGRRRQLLPLWLGVAAAVGLSVLFGALLTDTETALLADYRSRELFEAITSVLAVALVTWMVFWRRRTARRLKGEPTGKLEAAIGVLRRLPGPGARRLPPAGPHAGRPGADRGRRSPDALRRRPGPDPHPAAGDHPASVRNRLLLTADRLQGLSDSITALSESVSQVAAVVADR